MQPPYKWIPADSEHLLKITDIPGGSTFNPCIRISGQWLAAGFPIGARVKVTATLNEIRIINTDPVRSVVFEQRAPWTYTPKFRLRRRPVSKTPRKSRTPKASNPTPTFVTEDY